MLKVRGRARPSNVQALISGLDGVFRELNLACEHIKAGYFKDPKNTKPRR